MSDKLGWDADFYKSLPDTTRNVSLSEKEIYVLGNLLPMVSWSTRWSGDYSDLDLDAIRGNMEFTLLDEIEVIEMSCIDVADCIGSEAAVQQAITETVTNNGFAPNPETDIANSAPIPTVTNEAKTANLIGDIAENCQDNPQILMGIARAIVKELNESTEDFFEVIEYATNAAEATAMASDLIPYAGKVVSSAIEYFDWVLETMMETYQGSYTQTVEDELACAIFCHMYDNCSLSIEDLVNIYENEGSITIPPPDTDLDAILTFATETSLSLGKTCVAIFHYQILKMLSFGAFAGLSVVYLKSIIQTNVSAADYTYEDLCDCVTETPTTYWKMVFDFRISQYGTTVIAGANNGVWVGNGYQYNVGTSGTTLMQTFTGLIADLGATFKMVASANYSVRRGSGGNGTDDITQTRIYPNANYSGTYATLASQGGIAENSNAVLRGFISTPPAGVSGRSIALLNRVQEAVNSTSGMLRTYRVAIWGEANAGNVKPPLSAWAGNSLPATLPGLFE